MSRQFWFKNGKYSKAPRALSFKVKCKSKAAKDVQLKALQDGYLGFFLKIILIP